MKVGADFTIPLMDARLTVSLPLPPPTTFNGTAAEERPLVVSVAVTVIA